MFNKDHLGERISQSLIDAAKRGVDVRVLVDGAGTPLWGGGAFTKNLERGGVKSKVFHPYPWGLWQWSRSVVRLPSVIKIIYLILKMNARNHRKCTIIDNKIAFIGSFNIDRCHLNKAQGGKGWRDTGIRLKNINLENLQTAFEAAWSHQALQERLQNIFKHVNTNAIIRLNHTRHARRILYKNLLKRIARCQDRIWITNAYFVPDNFLLKKLKDAAETGIDVRILLPKKSDVMMMPWASTSFYRNLMRSGARIFEYLPSMLHAKTLIVDNWVIVGTSNLNHRSLLHDLEVDVTIATEKAKQKIADQFAIDLADSHEMNFEKLNKRGLLKRIVGRLMLYLKYMI
jgi:cardiolipin synthase